MARQMLYVARPLFKKYANEFLHHNIINIWTMYLGVVYNQHRRRHSAARQKALKIDAIFFQRHLVWHSCRQFLVKKGA